jgi:hypothetical protein
MASDEISVILDARKLAKSVTIRTQIKNMLWVRVGMLFIKIGAWISGADLVDEFPMSLIQPDDPEYRDRNVT